MWFWVVVVCAAVVNFGGTTLTGVLRRRGEIICREEKLCDFWILVAVDIALLLAFALQHNLFVLGLVVWYWLGWLFSWKVYLRHKDHEEDCIYGPRRKKQSVGARLKMFWKPRVLVSPT